mgnify:CR=1 FL=1
MNPQLTNAIKLLSVLAKVQRWEALNTELVRSASSRQIYFGLIRHLSDGAEGPIVDSMKEIYYDDGIQLTERGVRLTICAFEADGVLIVEKANTDRRSRKIYITEKLQQQMISHAEEFKKMLSNDFLVLEK